MTLKIRDLGATGTVTGTMVVPTAPTSGADTKTSFTQLATFIGNANNNATSTTYTTTTTITAAAIVGGIIYFNPADSAQVFTLPTAAQIYAAMGSPATLNTYAPCIFQNLSTNTVNFTSPDANLLLTGVIGLGMNPYQEMYLLFTHTQVSPEQITISGWDSTSVAKITSGTIGGLTTLSTGVFTAFGIVTVPRKNDKRYVTKSGNDSTGNRAILNPALTIAFVSSVAVLDVETIDIDSGTYAEIDFTIKPNLPWIGLGKNQTIITMATCVLNTTSWASYAAPYLDMRGLTLSSAALSFVPTAFISGSEYRFTDISLPVSPTLALVTNCTFDGASEVVNPILTDITNFKANPGTKFTGTITINSSVNAPAGASTVYDFEGCDLTGCAIIVNIPDDTAAITTLKTAGCTKPTSITFNDSSSGGFTFYSFDASSHVTPSDVSGNLQLTFLDHSPGIYVDYTGVNYSSSVHVLDGVISAIDSQFPLFGLVFEVVSTATKQLAWNRDYYFTNAGQCVCTMPAGVTSANSRMRLSSKGAGGFKIVNQSASQTITFLDKTTVAGTTGYIETVGSNQSISLVGDVSSILSTVTAAQGRVFNINTASGVETINGVGTSLPIVVTGTSVSMLPRQEYILNNAALVTATLPTTMAVGEKIMIVGQGAGLWKIAQNASQSIVFLSSTTTSGTGGSITATQRYQSVEITCLTANTLFSITVSDGASYTIV